MSGILTTDHVNWLNAHADSLAKFGRKVGAVQGGAYWLGLSGEPDPTRPVVTWLTCRAVHVYALEVLRGNEDAREIAAQAFAGLTGPLADQEHGGWFREYTEGEAPDTEKASYDHAFVLLASAAAVRIGLPGAQETFARAQDTFLTHFWDEEAGLAVDTWNRDFTQLDDYRGINGNMHTVEGLLAVAAITDDQQWLERAQRICDFVVGQAKNHNWLIPEHYDAQWNPELELNADFPDHPFKPYGATIGHSLEWARLLLNLEATLHGGELPADAQTPYSTTAKALFDRAVEVGWTGDPQPGFLYTTGWDGAPAVADRMHWVIAEGIGAAATLHRRFGEETYAQWYRTWWEVTQQNFIDPAHGSWFHQLDEQNQVTTTVWPGKPDIYHAYQAALIPQLRLDQTLITALPLTGASISTSTTALTTAKASVLP